MLNLKPPDSKSMRERTAAASGLVVMLNSLNDSETKGAASVAVRHSDENCPVFGHLAESGETARIISGVIPFLAGGGDVLFVPFLTGIAAAIVRREKNIRKRML